MITFASGILTSLIVYFFVGMGPAVYLVSGKRKWLVAFALSPVLGVAFTAVIGTILTRLGIPGLKWAGPWVAVSFISSSIFLVRTLKASSQWRMELCSELKSRTATVLMASILCSAILMVAPVFVGKQQFIILRGNGTDSFNYITGAVFLNREPLELAKNSTELELIQKNASYAVMKTLANDRWPTFVLLGFTSNIAANPEYLFDYGLSVLSLLLVAGPLFVWAVSMEISLLYAFLLVVGLLCGFWGQFVVDIRALSQIVTLPMLVVTAFLIYRMLVEEGTFLKRDSVLYVILLSSLVLLYVEVFSLVFAALAILTLFLVPRKDVRRTLTHIILLSGIGVLVAILVFPDVLTFFKNQLRGALSSPNDWHNAYFQWLYKNFFAGLWGLMVNPSMMKFLSPSVFMVAAIFMGVLLTLLFLLSFRELYKRDSHSPSQIVSLAFSLGAVSIFLLLYAKKQYWAAGKGLSYGFPFFFVALFAAATTWHRQCKSSIPAKLVGWTFHGAIGVWMLFQVLLMKDRIVVATRGSDYPLYLGHHGWYGGHDWNISELSQILDKTGQRTLVGIIAGEPWYLQFFALSLGLDHELVSLIPITDQSGRVIGSQKMDRQIDYLIINKFLLRKPDLFKPFLIAQNQEVILIKPPNNFSQLFAEAIQDDAAK